MKDLRTVGSWQRRVGNGQGAVGIGQLTKGSEGGKINFVFLDDIFPDM
jgi:hypothetical protein